MEHIKQNFSIKDLENLSGIKAHTIRIWEKRYDILNPERTETNIRSYNGKNLQKLLNIAFLNEHGYKISRISKMTEEEIVNLVKRITASQSEENRARNSFKISMMNFDDALFQTTYKKLREKKAFREIFYDVFLPLLEEIGVLWQTDTIKPIHEHYIVELIKQKLYQNIAEFKLSNNLSDDEQLYILFLPDNEIHDIGILYLNYELLSAGRKTIYLGSSLPLDNIQYLMDKHDQLVFLSYLTVSPRNTDLQEFIQEFEEKICEDRPRKLKLFGARARDIMNMKLPENIEIYKTINDFIATL